MGGKVCLTCAYVYNHQNSAEILQCSLLISQSPTDQNRALKEGAKKLLVKNSFFHSCFVFVPCTIPRSWASLIRGAELHVHLTQVLLLALSYMGSWRFPKPISSHACKQTCVHLEQWQSNGSVLYTSLLKKNGDIFPFDTLPWPYILAWCKLTRLGTCSSQVQLCLVSSSMGSVTCLFTKGGLWAELLLYCSKQVGLILPTGLVTEEIRYLHTVI